MAAQGAHQSAPDGLAATGGGSLTPLPADPKHLGAHQAVSDPAPQVSGAFVVALPSSQHLGTHQAATDPGAARTNAPLIIPEALTGSGGITVGALGRGHKTSADLTGASSLSYTEVPPPTRLTGDADLTADAVLGRTGGSTATVEVSPEGVGTKVLAGSTAVVLTLPYGEGVRIEPYTVHPNTRGDSNYVPDALAALAARRLNTPEPEQVVARPALNRQTWSSDVPISRPAPAPSEPLVDLGGFAFGPTGIMLPVTEEDVEAMAVPTHEEYRDAS